MGKSGRFRYLGLISHPDNNYYGYTDPVYYPTFKEAKEGVGYLGTILRVDKDAVNTRNFANGKTIYWVSPINIISTWKKSIINAEKGVWERI
jgi:hypothetical protein